MDSTRIQRTEVGSFEASDPEEIQFLGSSSGGFFVNTVFRAFGRLPGEPTVASTSSSLEDNSQNPEATIVKDYFFDSVSSSQEIDPEFLWSSGRAGFQVPRTIYDIEDQGMGVAPDQHLAGKLIQIFFRTWHPLFLFLRGPSF